MRPHEEIHVFAFPSPMQSGQTNGISKSSAQKTKTNEAAPGEEKAEDKGHVERTGTCPTQVISLRVLR